VPGRVADAEREKKSGADLEHGKLPDPVLRTLSETLDRQSLLEERVHELEQALSRIELPAPPIRTRELSPACKAVIREALKEVIEPEVGINVVDLGLIREIKMNGHGVEVRMALIHPQCSQAGYLIEQVRRKVKGVIGDEPVEVVLTDEGGV
jgi:serine O-acetyltransferase